MPVPRDCHVRSVGLDGDGKAEEQRRALMRHDAADLRCSDTRLGEFSGNVEAPSGAHEVAECNRRPEGSTAAPCDQFGCAHVAAVRAHDRDRGFGHAPGCTGAADVAATYPQPAAVARTDGRRPAWSVRRTGCRGGDVGSGRAACVRSGLTARFGLVARTDGRRPAWSVRRTGCRGGDVGSGHAARGQTRRWARGPIRRRANRLGTRVRRESGLVTAVRATLRGGAGLVARTDVERPARRACPPKAGGGDVGSGRRSVLCRKSVIGCPA